MLNIRHAVASMAKYDRDVRSMFSNEVNATTVIGKMEHKGAAVPFDKFHGLFSELSRLFDERRNGGETQDAIDSRCSEDDECTRDRAFGELIVGAFIDAGVQFDGEPWWRKTG